MDPKERAGIAIGKEEERRQMLRDAAIAKAIGDAGVEELPPPPPPPMPGGLDAGAPLPPPPSPAQMAAMSALAPSEAEAAVAAPTHVEMEPIYNSLGYQIGEKPAGSGGPLQRLADHIFPRSGKNSLGEDLSNPHRSLLTSGSGNAPPPKQSVRQPVSTVRGPTSEDMEMVAAADRSDRSPGAQPRPGMTMGSAVAHKFDPNVIGIRNDEQRQSQSEARVDTNLGRQAQTDIGTKEAEDISGILGEDLLARKTAADLQASRAEANQKAQELAIADFYKASEAARAMKVDPEAFVKSRSDAQRLSAGIALLFGGIASGINGGPNHAIDAINKLTEDSINAQRANIEQANGAVRDKHTLYGMLRDKGVSDEAASAAQRTAAREYVNARIGARMAESTSPEIKAKMQTWLGQQNEDVNNQKISDEMAIKRAIYMSHLGGPAPKPIPHTVTTPDGRTFAFQTEKDRENWQERMMYAQKKHDILVQAQALRKKRSETLNPLERARITNQLEGMAFKAMSYDSHANGEGQVKAEEMKAQAPVRFPLAAVLTPGADRIIENEVQDSRSSPIKALKTLGGELVAPGRKMTGQGMAPTHTYLGEIAAPDEMGMPAGSKRIEEE